MASSARMKSKKAQGKKPEADAKLGRRIRIEDLRVGDRIVVAWHRGYPPNMDNDRRNELSAHFYELGVEPRFVAKTKKVEKFEECTGMWRTHVHINRGDCHDMRGYIWVEE